MKVVLAGGSGQLGTVLRRGMVEAGHDVVVLSRSASGDANHTVWDAVSLGAWVGELDGADVVFNLAGRSVSCRYTDENLAEMLRSRVRSAEVIGEAIASVRRPPRVWLQMSTATIYAHRFDAPNDETTGIIGGDEPDVPDYWAFSVKIARDWEAALEAADTPGTRKVALRSAMVMNPDPGSVFDVLTQLVRRGLGGAAAGGRQFVSWIHEHDYVRACRFLIDREDLDGAVNLSSPGPLPHRALMADLRRVVGMPFGLPATKSMLELGAWAMRTDTELLLKSRRVVPGRLIDAGFGFDHPSWPEAAAELYARRSEMRRGLTRR